MNSGRMSWLRERGVLLLILAVVAAEGAAVLANGFFNYDDPQILLEAGAAGELLPTWNNLTEKLLPHVGSAWIPLRYLLFSLLYTLAGPTAWVYHLAGLLLYALLCLQVYLLSYRLLAWDGYRTGSAPWRMERGNFWPLAAALIFAASPLNVESLAWVSAVKDLLHAVFWMAFVLSIFGRGEPKIGGNRRALLYLVLALLSKPSAVVLPLLALVMLVLGPYDRKSIRLPRKMMWIAAAVIGGYLVYLVPQIPSITILPHAGGIQTVAAGALKVLFAYIGSFLVPVNLSVRYLVDVPLSVLDPATIARSFTLLALCLLVVHWRRAGRLLPSLALAWYLLALLPSSGVVPLEILRADRYALTMLPVLAISLSYGLRELVRGFGSRAAAAIKTAVLLIPLCFAILFVQRVTVWRSSETLWSDTLARDGRNWIAVNGLAHVELERGDTTAAIRKYERALEVNPDSRLALSSLAVLVEKRGEVERAGKLLQRADELRGGDLKSSIDLAKFYLRNGKPYAAAALLEKQDAAGVDDAQLNYLLSIVYRRTGHLEWAVARMKAARALDPDNAQYQAELGRLLIQQGELNDALRELGRALDTDPELVEGYLGFGELFAVSGQPGDAANAFNSALHCDPGNRDALLGLAGLYGSYGRLDSAAAMLDRLLARYPEDCMALANRVALYLSSGENSRAAVALHRAVACDSSLLENYINGYKIYVALDSLGGAGAMLGRAIQLAPSNPSVAGIKTDLERITGVTADTAAAYLARYVNSGAGRVTAARAPALLDSLRRSRR